MSHWVTTRDAVHAIAQHYGIKWYGPEILQRLRREGVFGPLCIEQPGTRQHRFLYDVEGIIRALESGRIKIPGIPHDWNKIVKSSVPYLDLNADDDGPKSDWIITPEGDLLHPMYLHCLIVKPDEMIDTLKKLQASLKDANKRLKEVEITLSKEGLSRDGARWLYIGNCHLVLQEVREDGGIEALR